MKRIAISLLLLFTPLIAIDGIEIAPDVEDWFEVHSILMQNEVPDIKEGWTEADVFLAIHPNMQRGYARIFWELREPGLDEVFYANLLYDGEKDEYDFSIIKSYSGYKEYFAPTESSWNFIRSWAVGWIRNYGDKNG